MRVAPAPLLMLLVVLAASCASDSSAACGPIIREELDPASLVHVLPGAPEAEYASDPPTSGPHQPGPDLDSFESKPLSKAVQVGVIERGGFLLQYDPSAFSDTRRLLDLSIDGLVVAPNPDLPDPVVLTAWTAKQVCSELDAAAVRAFTEARAGQAPGSDE